MKFTSEFDRGHGPLSLIAIVINGVTIDSQLQTITNIINDEETTAEA